MATGEEWRLTTSDIANLAAAIADRNMETIAERYLGIELETVLSLKDEHRGNWEAFNREIIRIWSYKNSSPDQKTVKHLNILLVSSASGIALPKQF